MSTSNALIKKRSSDTQLMPPPPPSKRIRRPTKVLDEDTYTYALSHIIARDFFPGLAESQSQQEYLDALDSKDNEWIASAGNKLKEMMTPGPDGRRARGRRGVSMTPVISIAGETPRAWGGDTPASVISDATTQTRQKYDDEGVDISMSLTAFQAKYTSEDNESFYTLLDKQNHRRSEKYAWLWTGNKIPSARQILHQQREQNLLANKRTPSDSLGRHGKVLALSSDSDTRPAKPDAWPNTNPANTFMFHPSSVDETTALTTIQTATEASSRAGPKAVVYDNTRFPLVNAVNDDNHPSRSSSPTLSAVQDAIAGRPRRTESSVLGSETPRVNGYAFVDSEEPEPVHSKTSSNSTTTDPSLLLSSIDNTPNPFHLTQNTRRESLHLQMVEKTARQKREKAADRTPIPKFTSGPKLGTPRGGLTPAAERLLKRVGTPKVGPSVGSRGNGWSKTPVFRKK
ncbi:MAG: hypothetical protein M1834_000290 [Cirrosporium novae-zelandiae]|nr:MAG: hypothetical protein M1834_000290 [Cirrosporium novae-zelandiae]